jgi:heme A synthase
MLGSMAILLLLVYAVARGATGRIELWLIGMLIQLMLQV